MKTETAFDPVSQHTIMFDMPISALYRQRVYYFESRENRDAFESDPEKYLAGSPTAGQPIGPQNAVTVTSRRKRGMAKGVRR